MISVVRPAISRRSGARTRSLDSASRPGRRLVEEQHRGVADHRPGDRQPLPLAARQQPAALPDPRVVPVGEIVDEPCASAARAAGTISSLRGVGPSPADVVGDRAVEDQRLLQHGGDVAAQVGEATSRRSCAVESDAPPVGVVEAQQQLGERRLARPAGPDHGDLLARGDRAATPVSDGRVDAGVGERDVLDARARRARGRTRRGVDGVDHRRLLVEDLDDPLGAGAGGVRSVGEAAERPDRPVELGRGRP